MSDADGNEAGQVPVDSKLGGTMDMKKLAIGTLVGGVVMFLLGYLIFATVFANFYAANEVEGVARDAPIYWAQVLGTFGLAALVTLALGWSGASSIGEAFKIGAIVGFLVWFGVDFILYGVRNVSNLTLTIVDPLLEIVRTGLSAAIIAAVLARTTGSATTGE